MRSSLLLRGGPRTTLLADRPAARRSRARSARSGRRARGTNGRANRRAGRRARSRGRRYSARADPSAGLGTAPGAALLPGGGALTLHLNFSPAQLAELGAI